MAPKSPPGRARFWAKSLLLLLLFLVPGLRANAAERPFLSLSVSAGLRSQPALACTLEDVTQLLQQGFPGKTVAVNARQARVTLELVLDQKLQDKPEGFLPWESAASQGYRWESRDEGGRVRLVLHAASAVALSHGLYGLLQEKLGFRFIHPRQTLIPRHSTWPLPSEFAWEAHPRFARRGFHLHTLHPIELADALHNPDLPGGAEAVRQYIDWLARNGQNLVQFYLLRDVDRDRWIPYVRTLADYAHRRGIRIGCMVSVAMLQQKAFQLVKLLRWESWQDQVRDSLDWLARVPWDFVTVEYTMGEHLPDLRDNRPGLEGFLADELEKRGIVPMIATHVIRHGEDGTVPVSTAPEQAGMLVHTVMCYSVTEPVAPVYGNTNLGFMAERARLENRRRETWFWPESAYWVAFDNSVPLLLLPYLQARHDDMRTMETIGLPGHLTFSSGWEWGYWLTDWSLARWSWSFQQPRPEASDPLQYLVELFPDPSSRQLWHKALAVQTLALKQLSLMPLMAAADPFSELPAPFDARFQPRSELSCGNILGSLPAEKVQRRVSETVHRLEAFASDQQALVAGLEANLRAYPLLQEDPAAMAVRRELVRSLEITALRAAHRAAVLQAALARRLSGNRSVSALPDMETALGKAAALRTRAQVLVWEQEKSYRYPLPWLSGRRPDLTAYHFGYLYPVSTLYFWKREEEQIRHGRCDAFFMNLWNFWRTLGLESLLF